MANIVFKNVKLMMFSPDDDAENDLRPLTPREAEDVKTVLVDILSNTEASHRFAELGQEVSGVDGDETGNWFILGWDEIVVE